MIPNKEKENVMFFQTKSSLKSDYISEPLELQNESNDNLLNHQTIRPSLRILESLDMRYYELLYR